MTFFLQLTDRLLHCFSRDFASEEFSNRNNFARINSAQRNFMRTLSAKCKGRDDVIEEVVKHVELEGGEGGEKGVPLVIVGGEGSGKTTALAKCVQLIEHKLECWAFSR